LLFLERKHPILGLMSGLVRKELFGYRVGSGNRLGKKVYAVDSSIKGYNTDEDYEIS